MPTESGDTRREIRAPARLKQYLIERYRTLAKKTASVAFDAPGSGWHRPRILFRSSPAPQNALDIFEGEWMSRLPEPLSDLRAGALLLFDDPRVRRFLAEIGGVHQKTVLELGPLEGGHSFMFDRAGAAEVIAVEANSRAFLKCLIVKELLGLPRVQFLCGDFVAYLRDTKRRFDVCMACGVLYHLQNPAELIALLAERCTESLYIWTHYYDASIVASRLQVRGSDPDGTKRSHLGFEHTVHSYTYRNLDSPTFCGGSAPTSCLMTKADIVKCLAFFGFDETKILGEQPDHVNGPAVELIARRLRR